MSQPAACDPEPSAAATGLRRRRRVVRIIARLNVGGPAQHVTWLSAGLRAEGFSTLLVAGVPPAGEQDMSAFTEAHGVRPLLLPELSRALTPRDLVVTWKLFRLLRRLQPDVVHTHTAKAGAVGRLAAWMYNLCRRFTFRRRMPPCAVIHTYHGHVFHGYFGRLATALYLAIERTLARLATDRIVVLSRRQREEIQGTFRVGRPEQFVIIPLGLDLTPYADWESRRPELRRELAIGDDVLLVGIVGRLAEVKNHGLFLAAARRCLELRGTGSARVEFVILGDGHLRESLIRQAAALGVTGNVRFLGNRTDPERFYPALDVVALTSRNEGTPLTLLEAMANARPVIATAVGGVVDLLGGDAHAAPRPGAECVEYSRGIAVRPDDVEQFARGLDRLLTDAELRRRLGREGLNYVRAHHDRRRLVDDVARLYRALLQAKRFTGCAG